MTNETTSITLNKLVAWDGNVRRTGATDGIEELAASIAAHGLLQSLVVQKGKRGKYIVIAGQRRLMALQKLASDKTIAKDADIPCVIAAEESDASELSLAENVVRMPMHPADQFEAFRGLIERGSGIADVAARFGVSETLVTQRLKLGRVSPVILDAYRKGEIGLELVQAFAISDDHEAQERVWNELPAWDMQPRTIKRVLTDGEIPSSDKRVKLVGLDAYEAAGGAIRRDLFDPEDGGTVLDAALLDSLVAKCLEAKADEIRSEGWRWVEIMPEYEYAALSVYERRYPDDLPFTDEEQAELDQLRDEYDESVDTDDEAGIKRLHEIDDRIDEIESDRDYWPDETLAIAGAIVTLDYHGGIRIERGLVKREDLPADDDQTGDDCDETAIEEPGIKLSARLVEDLTAQKSAAISAELAKRPDIALAAVVHALALGQFYSYAREGSCLSISATPTPLRQALYTPAECTGFTALEKARERWGDHLPGDPGDLWTWCCEQSQDNLLDLLAIIAARSVDAVVMKHGRPNAHADALAKAVSLDMADYFTPNAENFFGRISGAGIQAALCEASNVTAAPGWAKMKKADLAALATRQIGGTGWLPEPVRIANDDLVDSADGLPEAAE